MKLRSWILGAGAMMVALAILLGSWIWSSDPAEDPQEGPSAHYELVGHGFPEEVELLQEARRLRWQQRPEEGLKLLLGSPSLIAPPATTSPSETRDSPETLRHSWLWHWEVASLEAEAMRFGETLVHLERARQVAEGSPDADAALLTIFTAYGNLYRYLLQADAAQFYYNNAQDHLERLSSPAFVAARDPGNRSLLEPLPQDPAIAAAARLHASLYGFLPLSRKEEAIQHAREAARLGRHQEPETAAQTTRILASSLLLQKQHDACLQEAMRAAEIAREAGILREEIAALNLASLALFALDRAPETLAIGERAERIASRLEDPQPLRTVLQLTAHAHSQMNRPHDALEPLKRALLVVEEAWDREPVEALRRDYLLQGRSITTQILVNLEQLQALDGNSRALEALRYAERTRSRSLLARLEGEDHRGVNSAQRELLEEISTLARRRLELSRDGSVDLETVETLEEQRFELVARLIALEAQQQDRSVPAPNPRFPLLDGESAQAWLQKHNPGSTMLLYQLGPKQGFVVALRDDEARFVQLPNAEELAPLVRDWRHYAAQIPSGQRNAERPTDRAPADALDTTARRLGEILIAPVQDLVGDDLIIVLPDGVLHGLPFEALGDPRAPDREALTILTADRAPKPTEGLSKSQPTWLSPVRLIARHRVLYAPSISVLSSNARSSSSLPWPGSLLLLGDPVYAAVDEDPPGEGAAVPSTQPKYRNELVRLPASRREVVKIDSLAREHSWRTTLWTDSDASEARLRSANLHEYRLIHLATHAMTDSQQGDWSAMVLSATAPETASPGVPLRQPEIGSPGPEGDGILTAADIAQLDLTADLVVLSGCETGLGQSTGAEGILGLARAFLTAGAGQVMASLWKVEDQPTSELMTSFYRYLFEAELAPSQALRQAKMELARSGAAERTWAAFVLVGTDPTTGDARASQGANALPEEG